MNISDCKHYPAELAKPRTDRCEGGDQTSHGHLRVCLTCGHVGCCDSDINHHARKHAEESDHHVMANYPADETSAIWCYEHNSYLEP